MKTRIILFAICLLANFSWSQELQKIMNNGEVIYVPSSGGAVADSDNCSIPGAIGGDGLDDTAAIQAWINAGNNLCISEVYNVSSTLSITTPGVGYQIEFVGDGQIVQSADFNQSTAIFDIQDQDRLRIVNSNIRGNEDIAVPALNSYNNLMYGYKITNSDNIVISGGYLDHMAKAGVYLNGVNGAKITDLHILGAANFAIHGETVSNITVKGSDFSGQGATQNGNGTTLGETPLVQFTNADNITIHDNDFFNSKNGGSKTEGSTRIVYTNNRFKNIGKDAVKVQGVAGAMVDNVSITANRVEYLQGYEFDGDSFIQLLDANDFVVSNNIISGGLKVNTGTQQENGINIYATGANISKRGTVSGNVVHEVGSNGFYSENIRDVTYTGNHACNYASDRVDMNGFWLINAERVNILGGSVGHETTPLSGFGFGMKMEASVDYKIVAVDFYNQQDIAILCNLKSGNYVKILGNTFVNGGQQAVYTSGTGAAVVKTASYSDNIIVNSDFHPFDFHLVGLTLNSVSLTENEIRTDNANSWLRFGPTGNDEKAEKLLIADNNISGNTVVSPVFNTVISNVVYTDESGGGGGIADGDKGSITVTNGGATWTLDPNSVSSANIGPNAVAISDLNTNGDGNIGQMIVKETATQFGWIDVPTGGASDEKSSFSTRPFPSNTSNTIATEYPTLTNADVQTLTGNATATTADTAGWFYLQEVFFENKTNYYNVSEHKRYNVPSGETYVLSQSLVLDLGGSEINFSGTQLLAASGFTGYMVTIASQWGFGNYENLYIDGNYTAGGVWISPEYVDINNTLATVNHWELEDLHIQRCTIGLYMTDTYYGSVTGHSIIASSLTGIHMYDNYPNGWYGDSGPSAEVNTINFQGLDLNGPSSGDLTSFGVAANYKSKAFSVGVTTLNVQFNAITIENWDTAYYFTDQEDSGTRTKQPKLIIERNYFEAIGSHVVEFDYTQSGSAAEMVFSNNHVNFGATGTIPLVLGIGSYKIENNNFTNRSLDHLIDANNSINWKSTFIITDIQPYQIKDSGVAPGRLLVKHSLAFDNEARERLNVENYVAIGGPVVNNPPDFSVYSNFAIDQDKVTAKYPETIANVPTQNIEFQSATNTSLRDIAFTQDGTGIIMKDEVTGNFKRLILRNGSLVLEEENLLGRVYNFERSMRINYFLNLVDPASQSEKWYGKGFHYSLMKYNGSNWVQTVSGTGDIVCIGTTAERPTTRPTGFVYYDTDLNDFYLWNGAWGLANDPANDITITNN